MVFCFSTKICLCIKFCTLQAILLVIFHDEGLSEEFEVKVDVHQGSVFSLLLFIIVLQALSHEFWAGVPWEDLYADDLVIIADSMKECVRRLLTW